MDDEQVVEAEESSRSASASRRRSTSKLSSMGSGRESSSKASSTASRRGSSTEPSSTTRRSRSVERKGGGEPVAGVNPFWSERVKEEMRLREARSEGLPPVPESGDEEEVARTPLSAAQEETAAQRRKARAFMTPEERWSWEWLCRTLRCWCRPWTSLRRHCRSWISRAATEGRAEPGYEADAGGRRRSSQKEGRRGRPRSRRWVSQARRRRSHGGSRDKEEILRGNREWWT